MTGSLRRTGLTVDGARATLRRMMLSRPAGVLVIAILASIAPARADDIKPITIVAPGERSTNNKLVLGAIAGAGVLAGAVGLYFHLDSRSATDEVGTDVFTGEAWTPAHQELVDQANRSRTSAIVGYSLGGAALLGAAVYWIVTEPPEETIIIQPRSARPTIAPVPGGGAVIGGTWSF